MSKSWRGVVMPIVAASAVVAALAPGCSRNKVAGEGRLELEGGRVLLTRDDKPKTVARSISLVTGDTVEVTDGSAKVTFPGGDMLELPPRSIVRLRRGPEVRSGNVLVSTVGPARLIQAAGSQVEVMGSTRIDVSLALRVVTYRGGSVVKSGGRAVLVPALREVSVPVAGVLRGPRPLAIDPADAWDQRFLGDVVAKESDLESRARGFTGQVSSANAESVAYYQGLLPELVGERALRPIDLQGFGRSPSERADVGRFRAGDVLVGAAIALQGQRGAFVDRLTGASAFRAEGASWALVSLDQEVPSIDSLLRLVDSAVNVAPLELAAPASRPPPVVVPVVPAPTRPPTTKSPETQTTTKTTTVAPPPTTVRSPLPLPPDQLRDPQPTPPPLVIPLDRLLEAAIDPVVKLLNDLLGGRR